MPRSKKIVNGALLGEDGESRNLQETLKVLRAGKGGKKKRGGRELFRRSRLKVVARN